LSEIENSKTENDGAANQSNSPVTQPSEDGKKKMSSTLTESETQKSMTSIPELSKELERNLVQIFKLLSDETRLRILLYLARQGELHVTALCEKLGQSQPAVSHHLALLRVAGLIEPRRDGKHNFYSVRRIYFHRVMDELFGSLDDAEKSEIRFDDYVLTQGS